MSVAGIARTVLLAGAAAGAVAARGDVLRGRVVDADGRPVSGASVSAFARRSPERRLLDDTRGEKAKAAAETKTDAAGAFTVRVDAGVLDGARLRVDAPGLPAVEMERLDASDAAEDLELMLSSTSALAGRVSDESGKPVAGARVSVTSIGDGENGSALAETRTAADGGFALPNAPGGGAEIAVRADGFLPWVGQRESHQTSRSIVLARGGALSGVVRDASGVPAAGEIVVCDSQAAETDGEGRYRFAAVKVGRVAVGLRSTRDSDLAAHAEPRVEKGKEASADLRLERRASVAGVVVDQRTGRPIAGATVSVNDAEASTDITAETDSRGRFRIGGLAARPYSLMAVHKGYLPESRDARASRGPANPVTISMRPAGTLIGKVVDERGAAIAAARVMRVWVPTMRSLRNGTFSPVVPSTFTRMDGTFRLKWLPPGGTAVVATKEGYAPARRDAMEVPSGRSGPAVTLVLKRGAAAQGSVVDAEGRPVPGAEVFVSAARASNGSFRFTGPWESRERPSAVAGPDGRFAAAALPEGRLTARVSASGFATRSFDALEASRGAEPAAWKPFVLSRGAAISGAVRNVKGEPVPNATLSIFGGAQGYSTTTSDAEGRFRFDQWAAGESLEIAADAAGYASKRQRVTAPADDLNVVLATSARIRGRVEDAGAKTAIDTFSVGFSSGREGLYRPAAAQRFESTSGEFELADITPGRVTLEASAPGYVEAEVGGLELAEGETREGVIVSLRRGATLTGHVLDSEKRDGVGSAVVTWARAGAEDSARSMWTGSGAGASDTPHTATTDPDGTFRFDGLPKEKLQLVARHADYLETESTVDVASVSDTDLELSRGGTLAGVVVGADGAPVEGAAVAIEGTGSARSEWNGDESPADAAGRFSFEHLADGRYRLTATAPSGRSDPLDVVLSRGQSQEGLRLSVRAGTSIVGQVSGLPAGRLGGLQVWAHDASFSGEAKTDDAGSFRIPSVPAGAVSIVVSMSGGFQGRYVEKTVEVPGDAAELPVSIVFEGDSRLSGRVLRGGQGVAGAYVSVSPEPRGSGASSAREMTDADGRYAAEGLSDGTYTVSVSGDSSVVKRTVDVSGDTALDVTLGGSRLSGAVVDDESGEPLDGATVQADNGSADRVHGIPGERTDSTGAYEITELEPGDYRVTAARSGYASKTQAITIGDEPAQLDLRLRKGSGLPIHVFDAVAGLPIRGVDVLAFGADGALAFHGTVSLDDAGKGEVPSLSSGTFALRLFAEGYAPRALVANAPGPAVEAPLTPGGRVEVRSIEAVSGQSLAGDGGPYLASPWQLDGRLDVRPPLTVWDHFAPGAYRFVAGERSWSFTVEEGKTTTLELK